MTNIDQRWPIFGRGRIKTTFGGFYNMLTGKAFRPDGRLRKICETEQQTRFCWIFGHHGLSQIYGFHGISVWPRSIQLRSWGSVPPELCFDEVFFMPVSPTVFFSFCLLCNPFSYLKVCLMEASLSSCFPRIIRYFAYNCVRKKCFHIGSVCAYPQLLRQNAHKSF